MKLYEIKGPFNFMKPLSDYPFIGEVSCHVGIGKVVECNGSYYSPCVLQPNEDAAGVRKVKTMNLDAKGETFCTSLLTCPVCGHTDDASFELDDTDDNYECPCCGAILEYEREVTVSYSAKVVKLPTVNK